MIQHNYIPLLKGYLADHPIDLKYDKHASRRFAAQWVYFLLLFGLSCGLFYRRVLFVENSGEQMIWDICLAVGLLIWSGFIATRAVVLRPQQDDGIQMTADGVSSLADPSVKISWDEMSSLMPLPWLISFKGKSGVKLRIVFFQKDFSRVSGLFDLLVLPVPKKQIKKFNREAEIKAALSMLATLGRQ